MLEAIATIVIAIIEPILKHKFHQKKQSACQAIYLMYLNVCGIIQEGRKVVTEIDVRLSGKVGSYPSHELKRSLLEIYRKTDDFVENARYINELVGLYDPETQLSLEIMRRLDGDIFYALNSILQSLKDHLRQTDELLDYSLINPAERYPVRLRALLSVSFGRELDRSRQLPMDSRFNIHSLEDLQRLQRSSIEWIDKLERCAEQLAEFIEKNCSYRDFLEMHKTDMNILRSRGTEIEAYEWRDKTNYQLNPWYRTAEQREAELASLGKDAPWYFIKKDADPASIKNPEFIYEYAARSGKAHPDELQVLRLAIEIQKGGQSKGS